MGDSSIGLPADGPGKKLDTEQLTTGAGTVERERMQVAGAAAGEILRVVDTDPAGTDHGVVTRDAPPISPILDALSSANLANGASVDLDGTTIGAAKTGKLLRVTVGCSVACKWEIKTRDGAVLVTKAVLFTSGVSGGRPTETYTPTSKEMVTLAGNGVDENFRVTATNLSGFDALGADVAATIEWDEV